MPKHLVMLYQQSQGRKAPQKQKFEANFNLHPRSDDGAGCSHDVPSGPNNAMIPYPFEDPAETEGMLLEYTSKDMFGDFD